MSAGALLLFLAERRVCKGYEFTHTSLGGPAGSYYVPAIDHEQFMQHYTNAIVDGAQLALTEKHRHIGPILVDLDFRFDANENCKNVRSLAPQICQIYSRVIRELLDVDTITFYVMARPDGPTISKGLMKDGLHIVVPDVVTRADVQHMIRSKVMADIQALLNDELVNMVSKIEDVIDEAIIEKNNWMMYGSCKPGCTSYNMYSVLQWKATFESALLQSCMDEVDVTPNTLVNLLSIRNKHKETPIRDIMQAEVDAFSRAREHRIRMRETVQSIVMQEDDKRLNSVSDSELNKVEQLVEMLSVTRADSYNEWIRVGWCLRNIDYRLLPKWCDFSRKSTKYMEGECERLWDKMRTGGLGMGTLHMWARNDSPAAYTILIRSDLNSLIALSANGTHYDVARVVHHMYRYDYACASIKMRIWYEFRGHRWVETDSAYTLRSKISTEVVKEYHELIFETQRIALSGTCEDVEQKRLLDLCQKLTGVTLQLKKTAFKDNVMRECCELFMIEKFCDLLDSNCSLIGFDNGVYDLERFEFRDGRPDDYISFSTGCTYIPYRESHPIIADIKKFFNATHPREDVRNYVLHTLSDCLSGHIRYERLNVWTGSGSNGKSITIALMEKAFGDYCCKFPVTLLTRQRAASNAATSEIARAKGRRLGVLQEPCENEHLNIGLMKELSGGDTIQCRELYKPPVEWRPQFKLFLQCNHLPTVPSDDGGTWRRIRVVEFGSKFVPKPDPEKPNEFPMDIDLKSKLDIWKEHFISMLVHIYVSRFGQIIEDPESVTAFTRQYQRDNDHLADFVDSRIEPKEDSFLSIDDAMRELREWNREQSGQDCKIKKNTLIKYLNATLKSKAIQIKGTRCQSYEGYAIKM